MRGLFVRKSTVKPDFAGRKNRAYRLSVPICSVLLKMSDIIAYGNIFLCLVLWHYDFNRRDYGNSLLCADNHLVSCEFFAFEYLYTLLFLENSAVIIIIVTAAPRLNADESCTFSRRCPQPERFEALKCYAGKRLFALNELYGS